MRHEQEEIAIVLRSQPFQERDRLVSFLTENQGRISGIAKGAIHSKRYGGSLDLFTCSVIRYKESPNSELVRIEEANTRKDFLKLRERLENISAAGYFTDLVLRLTEERQSSREIFLLLAHYFKLLEEVPASMEIVRSFEIKFLERLGWAPILEECVSCEKAFFAEGMGSGVSLELEKGGFCCESCTGHTKKKIPLDAILWMIRARETMIQHTPSLKFSEESMSEAVSVLQQFLRWHAPGLGNYNFRSHSMLERFLEDARREEVNTQSIAANKSLAT